MDNLAGQIIGVILRDGPQSKAGLARRLSVRFNSVGEAVDRMTADRFLVGGVPGPGEAGERGRGRPAEFFDLCGDRHRLLGVAILRGRVEWALTDLKGQPVGARHRLRMQGGSGVARAAEVVRSACEGEAVLGVGVSVAGLVDPGTQEQGGASDPGTLLFSAAQPTMRGESLQPIAQAAGGRPVTVDNTIHALAECWRINDKLACDQDVLLVSLGDGELGASILLHGPPNPGCVRAANELGHMTLPVRTARCYCGNVGCVERVLSSEQIRLLDPAETRRLRAVLADERLSPAGGAVLSHTARVLAGVVNLLRPDRVVLTGPLTRSAVLVKRLHQRVRRRLLPVLAERVLVECWRPAWSDGAVLAASLVLGELTRSRGDQGSDRFISQHASGPERNS